jgi:hypothetical protein
VHAVDEFCYFCYFTPSLKYDFVSVQCSSHVSRDRDRGEQWPQSRSRIRPRVAGAAAPLRGPQLAQVVRSSAAPERLPPSATRPQASRVVQQL